jgi:hypothetical protein
MQQSNCIVHLTLGLDPLDFQMADGRVLMLKQRCGAQLDDLSVGRALRWAAKPECQAAAASEKKLKRQQNEQQGQRSSSNGQQSGFAVQASRPGKCG